MNRATPAMESGVKGSALPTPESIDEGLCSNCGKPIVGRGLMASFCLPCITERRKQQYRHFATSDKGRAAKARWLERHPDRQSRRGNIERRREYERIWKRQWRAKKKAA